MEQMQSKRVQPTAVFHIPRPTAVMSVRWIRACYEVPQADHDACTPEGLRAATPSLSMRILACTLSGWPGYV